MPLILGDPAVHIPEVPAQAIAPPPTIGEDEEPGQFADRAATWLGLAILSDHPAVTSMEALSAANKDYRATQAALGLQSEVDAWVMARNTQAEEMEREGDLEGALARYRRSEWDGWPGKRVRARIEVIERKLVKVGKKT